MASFGNFDYAKAVADLNAKFAGASGGLGGSRFDRYRAELDALNRQQGGGGATSAMGMDSAEAKAQRAHDELFGLARGRLDELRGDNTDQMVLNALRERSGAGAGPYDATTINALMTGAAAQSQHSERNALAQLAKTGLSPSDPAYQSAAREIMARRQGQNQQARLGIQQQANVANYGARGQAIGQLGSFNAMRNSGITDASRYLGGLLGADTFTQQEAAPAAPSPQMYWMQQAQQQQAPQQQVATRPAPTPTNGPGLSGTNTRQLEYNAMLAARKAAQPQPMTSIPGTYNPNLPTY